MIRNSHRFRYGFGYRLFLSMTILAMLLGSQASSAVTIVQAGTAPAPLALTNTLMVHVVSATDSSPITVFKYIINVDNTATTSQRSPADGCSPSSPGYPDSCKWVSIAGVASSSPIFTQGDQSDFAGGGIPFPSTCTVAAPCRYLISVLADGYKIDGSHFTVPLSGSVQVQMQPYNVVDPATGELGLPDATIQAEVFEDMAPTNSAPDVPAERGLAGFVGHIKDYIDEVTTDVYGDPLCGNSHCVSHCYVVDGGLDHGWVDPVDSYGRCPIDFIAGTLDENGDPIGDPLLNADITQTSDGTLISSLASPVIEGKVIIPNLGPNRYALSVTPPNNSGWLQTTTLEGNHDWDAWVMEGATGLDTEFVVAGEPFPATFFGYVLPCSSIDGSSANNCANTPSNTSGSGTVKGTALAVSAYIPPVGGITGEVGLLGAKPKDKNPIKRLIVSLSDLNNGDQTVFVGEFDCNAACDPVNFSIPNVPVGDYVLGVWDEPQDYIFGERNVSVTGSGTIDIGDMSMLGWWTTIEGHVFNDLNENGKMDPGEPGIPNFFISMRTRENSVMDRGTTSITTDGNGYYWMESAYPITQWLVEEAYADGFMTTGITYQADNQSEETTVLGQGVDVNLHPVIGLGGRLDWGVRAYNENENGGIVGTVSYDTTRNELDPSFAAIEDWQPSISGLPVDLYAPVLCEYDVNGDPIPPCDPSGFYQLNADGSYKQGSLLNQYISETWERPTGCVARNVDGNPLVHGVDENVLPLAPDAPCIEAPMMSVQFGPMSDGTNFGAAVDGNYGFGDGCYLADGITPGVFDPTAGDCSVGTLQSLPSNTDFLVKVNIPNDALGRPMYKVTREEDINIANGDAFVPQVPPPSCAGALHTVDVDGDGTDAYPAIVGDGYDGNGVPVGVTVPASTPTINPNFVGIGGTPYESQPKALCDVKLVHLSDRKSVAPGFNFFTDVPLPGRFWGLTVDDLNFSSDPKSQAYGEKLPLAFNPVGIYDYTNRLIYTVESDYNGLWDVLLPSTNRISCPTPSGVCANLYRFEGNDPGTPGHWNANYNPQYRTISAEFEAFPGLTLPADLAPTPVAVAVQIPGSQTLSPVACNLTPTQPQLLAVSTPYVDLSNGLDHSFTIDGFGFGAAGQVLLNNVALPTTAWSDTHIAVTVPAATARGSQQLIVKSANGMSTVNGLTFHVLADPTFTPGAFPTTGVLDNFNGRSTMGGNWDTDGGGGFAVIDNTGTANDYLRIRTNDGSTSTGRWTSGASFNTNQEAYFTFRQRSTASTADQQGLMLKWNGTNSSNPANSSARWIEVAVDNSPANTVNVYVKTGSAVPTVPAATFTTTAFGAGDILGARALANGTINVYRNGTQVGTVNVAATGAWTGDIGIRFEGTGNGTPASAEAQIDNFGGGNVTGTTTAGYKPNVYEVGPAHTYATIQGALDAAAASNGDDLVVVYPGAVDPTNPRYNGRGAYYENLIMYSPVKLQGVGPGGVQPGGGIVQGSIIDGIAFGGDTQLATDWLAKIGTLTWSGNQDVTDGQVIYVLASSSGNSSATQAGSFGSTYKASIDGFDIRGGDQQGIPGNLNAIFGGEAGAIGPVQVETQGGAIFVNSYANNLQITNNVVENNGGAYGTIRIGTPNLPAPDTDNQNNNVRIANNRILANGGTNLAGAIGLFNGSDGYEVDHNDLCGNFSAEYGGAISHFGRNNATTGTGGKVSSIHDNRIYFNHSYDEGAGIMIAGELPINAAANYGTSTGPQGSGPVNIYNNLIQANLSEDDGGGLRFLMAGNFPMNVYNNMIVNNVATHEGGGVAIDDAPNVRFLNNTVMQNITTATAITSDGNPVPTGLSTGANSNQLQPTLPGGSPLFSNPLLFNNIFWDNRAGSKGINTVTGITAGDANPWDLGVVGNPSFLLSPTNSIVQQNAGTHPYTTSPTNSAGNPNVVAPFDIPLTFSSWRTNVNFIGAIMVTAGLPPTLMGNYHITNTSPAVNTGAANKAVPTNQQPAAPLPYQATGTATLNAPTTDIDNETRPSPSGFDKGADEVVQPTQNAADLSITKTDNQTVAIRGTTVTYTITVSNAGPGAVVGATVTDTFPASLTGVTWTCSPSPVSSCAVASGSGNISTTVNLGINGNAVFTASGTLSGSGPGTLSNTATVVPPAGTSDPTTPNTATDTDAIVSGADLSITKTDGITTINPGAASIYTIVVSNAGPNAVTGASVLDQFPSVLTVGSWTCTATAGSSCTVGGSGNNRSGTVTLAINGSATFTANTTLAANAPAGFLSNSASVTPPAGTGDPNTVNNVATDTDTIVPRADLSITKTDGALVTTIRPGGHVFYTIVVRNTSGPNAVTGAIVSDTFPANFTGVTWNCVATGGATCGGPGSGSGDINRVVNIPVGGIITFTTTAGTLDNYASGTLSNRASVTAPGTFDSNLANNSATDIDTVLPAANLAISKTHTPAIAFSGGTITYSIVVTNTGPAAVTGATVVDNFSANLTGVTWTCAPSGGGASCGAASGSGNINTTVNLPVNRSATYTVTGTVLASFIGTLTNTATITSSVAVPDPNTSDNSATDTAIVVPPPPTLTSLDTFNRPNANSLGGSWSQANTGNQVDIRVNGNQAFANQTNDGAQAIWNASFGANQGAAMTLAGNSNNARDNSALILKANAGTVTNPTNFIRVRYISTGTDRVVVETTTNAGGSYTLRATFNTTFAQNDILTASVSSTGLVRVWQTSGSTVTYLGSIQLPTTGGNSWTTGSGRIGIKIQNNNARVDNFRGGTLP